MLGEKHDAGAKTLSPGSSAGNRTLATVPPRVARLIHTVMLLSAGLAVTLTAPVHEQLSFDIAVLATSFTQFTIAYLFEFLAAPPRTPARSLLGASALATGAAAVNLPAATGSASIAMILVAWAGIVTTLTVFRLRVQHRAARSLVAAGVFGAAGIAALIATRDDLVAIVGFFGLFVITLGVFHGIALCDPRPQAKQHT